MVLKTKFKDHAEHYHDLGNQFSIIDKDACPEKFNETAKRYFGSSVDHFIKDTRKFIVYNEGGEILPIYIEQYNWIYSSDGSIFKDLSYF